MLASEAEAVQTENPLFVCADCGEPVIIYEANLFFMCEHGTGNAVITKHGVATIGPMLVTS